MLLCLDTEIMLLRQLPKTVLHLEMWEEDCKLDELNLGQESTKIPELHSKYLNMLTTFKLQLRKNKSNLLSLRRLKWKYF